MDIRHFTKISGEIMPKKKKNRTHAEIIDEIRELHDQEDQLLDELEDTCCSVEDKAFKKRLEHE